MASVRGATGVGRRAMRRGRVVVRKARGGPGRGRARLSSERG